MKLRNSFSFFKVSKSIGKLSASKSKRRSEGDSNSKQMHAYR